MKAEEHKESNEEYRKSRSARLSLSSISSITSLRPRMGSLGNLLSGTQGVNVRLAKIEPSDAPRRFAMNAKATKSDTEILLSKSALKVYAVLMAHPTESTLSSLAFRTGLKEGTITAARKELVHNGLMALTSDTRGNRYRFTPGDATVITTSTRRYRRHVRPFMTAAERELLGKATAILGLKVPPETEHGKHAVRLSARRIREGFTADDLLRVVRDAERRWRDGDHWYELKNLVYLWGDKFPALLAAARAPAADGMHFTDEDPLEWGRKLVERRGKGVWK